MQQALGKTIGASHLNAFEFGGNLERTRALVFLYNKAWATHLLARRTEDLLELQTQQIAEVHGREDAVRLMELLFDKCTFGTKEILAGACEPTYR